MNLLTMPNLTQVIHETRRLPRVEAQLGSVPKQDCFVFQSQRHGNRNCESSLP